MSEMKLAGGMETAANVTHLEIAIGVEQEV